MYVHIHQLIYLQGHLLLARAESAPRPHELQGPRGFVISGRGSASPPSAARPQVAACYHMCCMVLLIMCLCYVSVYVRTKVVLVMVVS